LSFTNGSIQPLFLTYRTDRYANCVYGGELAAGSIITLPARSITTIVEKTAGISAVRERIVSSPAPAGLCVVPLGAGRYLVRAPGASRVRITDLRGRTVALLSLDPARGRTVWDGGRIARGCYIVEARIGARLFVEKVTATVR
jgi:hypothetical protein